MFNQLPFAPFFAHNASGMAGAGPRVGVPELLIITIVALAVTLIPATRLRTTRKVALIGLLSVAALATPTPDPLTMLYAFAPLYLIFEMALFVMRVAQPHRGVRA